jgi:hypothetical protein
MTYTEYLYQTLSPEAMLVWKVVGCLFVLYKLRVRVRRLMKATLTVYEKTELKIKKFANSAMGRWGSISRRWRSEKRRCLLATLAFGVGISVLAGALFWHWKTGNPIFLFFAFFSVGPLYYGFSTQGEKGKREKSNPL